MGFSEKQDALVKEAWAAMKDDLLAWSLYYFTQVVEVEPRAKEIFSFLKVGEEVPLDNPKLKAHAFNTFKMICESAIQLRDKGEIVVSGTTLKWLGTYHHKKGVLAPYFEVVKEASLRTVEKAMGEKWSEDVKDAWVEAYDQLAGAIIAEMKEENDKTAIKS